jgi:DNA topoisomerase-1
MTNHLVIVESPAKAKTIKKYLGKGFEVLASYGHVRDLRPKEGAVDPENNFEMHYAPIEKSAKYVALIAKALKKADVLYLATDPDREGEAISWHVLEMMREQNILKDKPAFRIVFNEITKTAIKAAVKNPRDIAMDLVNAQQARRALDYLVGFNLSPLLWKKVRPGLSAGRVQSPALRLIVERELEIEAFKSQEYWTVEADATTKDNHAINSRLVELNGEKVEQFTITETKQAEKIKKQLLKAANGKLIVSNIEKKQRKRNPSPPFITSTLQQEAARKLGFTTSRTMQVAQQLYEGIDIGDGAVGLITYMRTDSVNLAAEAVAEIREVIKERYGADNVPEEPRTYKTRAKNAQEAHEAIRPTSSYITPDSIKDKLKIEQYKLYNLIWQRAVASQMISATLDTVTVDLSCGKGNRFRANGSTITIPGFISVYQEGHDDHNPNDGDANLLPIVEVGDELTLNEIKGIQHFTEPPPRFTEASLVKALEEFGIGRPSTYASIIYTLKHREYVSLDSKRFKPTDVGRVVARFLNDYFTQYVDYNFTAGLEDQLDHIAAGEQEWVPMLEKFWSPFITKVKEIDTTVTRQDVTQEKMDEACPECAKPLSIRLGRRGSFIGCTNYPECKYTRNVNGDQEETAPEEVEGRTCPTCNEKLIIRHGRYGKFIGCSKYPECKYIEPLIKPKETNISCPECKEGTILERRSRYGKIFYSCSRYPDCKYAQWNEPVEKPCPLCDFPITAIKTTKRRGTERVCPQKECTFSEEMEPPPEKTTEE